MGRKYWQKNVLLTLVVLHLGGNEICNATSLAYKKAAMY